MNDCSTNAMSAPKPIHGEIFWKDGMRPTPLSYARYVNGVERVADHIDFDGERYERVRECKMRVLWCDDVDGICWICSECDRSTYTHGWVPVRCSNCGARVKEGGDD